MTTPTPHGQVPEALRPIQRFNNICGLMNPAARGLYVRYEDHVAAIAALHAAHVQNPAEIEHVAGDVSKNRAEVNMNAYAELPPSVGEYKYGGGLYTDAQMRVFADATHALRAQQPAPATQQAGWTNADADAARLALELECLLMDTKDAAVVSKWWASANDALEMHRARLQEVQPSPTPPSDSVTAPAGGGVAGIEAAAKLLERKAEDFARENGSDDLGSLSFGRGAHADAKLEYHSTLLELAEEIRSLAPPPPAQAADSVLEDAAASEVLMEHSGCGSGTQVDMLTVRLNPGDKVIMLKGRMTQAIDAARKQGGAT